MPTWTQGCGDIWCAGPRGSSVPTGAQTPPQGSNRGAAVAAVSPPVSVCGGAVRECGSRTGISRGINGLGLGGLLTGDFGGPWT